MKNKNSIKPFISVIIPTYNEAGSIVALVEALQKVLHGYHYEIIIVDDRSIDGTAALIQNKFSKDKTIDLHVHQPPSSLGDSILQGIRSARGTVIIGMDADFNHEPVVIKKLLQKISNNDLVIASRFISDGGMENQYRYWMSYLFNSFIKKLFKFPVMDNTSGFYAVRSSFLKKLPISEVYQGYGEYHLRLVYLAMLNCGRITEVATFYKNRNSGESKSKLWNMFFSYFGVCLDLKFFSQRYLIKN